MHSEPDNPAIEIFSGTSWEAEMVHSLLEDAGIRSFLKNNVLGEYLYDPILASGVKVMVLESDLEAAREIVEMYYGNLKEYMDE